MRYSVPNEGFAIKTAMKFIRTSVIFDQGGLIESKQWALIHEAYTGAVRKIVHPPGNDRFLIRKRTQKLDSQGRPTKQWMRNGVKPLKEQFLNNLTRAGWRAEMPVSIGREILEAAGPASRIAIKDYPSMRDFNSSDADWINLFREQVGEFDFYSELEDGIRCAIEWETGNISSCHRSMNKLCLVMMAGLIYIGVLILPSRLLYPHLTDRIGNWEELSSYMT